MSGHRFKIPQAFRDLGIPFFLHLDPRAEDELKKHHVRETRRWHPDLLPPDTSDEDREKSETRLASLNAAYLKLRDTASRLDLVIDQLLTDNPGLKTSEKPELPSDLAMKYFDLRDGLDENPQDPATGEALKGFYEALSLETGRLDREIGRLITGAELEITDVVEAPADFVSELLALRNRERYLKRLQSDLENRLPR